VVEQVGPGRVADAPDRRQVSLLVQHQSVVDLPVEVDRQLRDPQERSGPHQVLGAVAGDQPPGQLELTVQPGVEQRPAVDLDACLQPAVPAGGRPRLELEARRVGVRADDAVRRGGPGSRRDRPGEHRAVPHDVLPLTRVPVVGLDQPGEARLVQPPGHLGRRVVRRG
jgi:hypothetical protein